jgi:hypothetical protein
LKFRYVIPLFLAAFAVQPISAEPDASKDAQTREIIERYVEVSQRQQEGLRGLQMDMDIDAKLPKLEKSGTFHALRSISRLGQITYNGLRFIGDNTIKNDVIARYLRAENETKNVRQLAVTPENYKFKYKGMNAADGHLVHVFQVEPRKKSVGLFKGELWLDAQTCLPVRESGRFVKNPSVFLKKIQFVRQYEIRDGIAIPRHIESTVDTRLWGPAEMSIEFSNFARTSEAENALEESSRGNQ